MKTNMKFNIIIEPAEEGGFMAFIEEMPNVCTQGETLEEVKENLKDAFEMVMDANRELKSKQLRRPSPFQ